MPTRRKISVVLIDDHTILRQGIRALLERQKDINVVGEAKNGQDAISLIQQCNPDVVLMDLDMPILNGIEATKISTKEFPKLKIIILSMFADDEFVKASINAGAMGFLVKESASEELIKAIREVNQGGAFFSPTVSKVLINEIRKPNYYIEPDEKGDKLTSRERQILQLISEGFTSKRIANKLFVSVSTVQKHRENIMKKINIHDVVGLTKYALQKGIIVNKKPRHM